MSEIQSRLAAVARDLVAARMTKQEAADEFERQYLAIALEVAGGNVTHAARLIGVHRNTIMGRRRALLLNGTLQPSRVSKRNQRRR